MYIINFQHFLDQNGNIPYEVHCDALRLYTFVASIVDEASKDLVNAEPTINCNKRGCDGKVVTWVEADTDDVVWTCPKCNRSGRVSNWQGSKWDNTDNL